MNYKISCKEMAEKSKEVLSRQQHASLEEAKQQVLDLKKSSTQKSKKQRN